MSAIPVSPLAELSHPRKRRPAKPKARRAEPVDKSHVTRQPVKKSSSKSNSGGGGASGSTKKIRRIRSGRPTTAGPGSSGPSGPFGGTGQALGPRVWRSLDAFNRDLRQGGPASRPTHIWLTVRVRVGATNTRMFTFIDSDDDGITVRGTTGVSQRFKKSQIVEIKEA